MLALAFALATIVAGWWGVLVLGAVWGVVARASSHPGWVAAAAAGSAWLALLLWTATQGPVGLLAAKVGGVMGVSGWALIGLTVLYPTMLAGSVAATVSRAWRVEQASGGGGGGGGGDG